MNNRLSNIFKKRSNAKRIYSIVFSLLLVVGLTFTACEGPAGPQGPPGPRGPEGPRGPQGPPGTANVMYSDWMDFQANMINLKSVKSMYVIEKEVTDELLSTGDIHVYMKLEPSTGDKVVIPVPSLLGTVLNFNYFAYIGNNLVDTDGDGKPDDFAGLIIRGQNINGSKLDLSKAQVRYVLIPGGNSLASKTTINWDDYSEVKALLNLQK